MTLTAGATVRTPDGETRTVVKNPYWFTAIDTASGPLVLLSDGVAWAKEALEPIATEVAA